MECCNNAICAILFPCPCFNKFYPGFRDADGFVRALNNVRCTPAPARPPLTLCLPAARGLTQRILTSS